MIHKFYKNTFQGGVSSYDSSMWNLGMGLSFFDSSSLKIIKHP
jgi:hypothetical protein